ncbi:GlcG/HbpS family heme-binding protein [Rhodoplanes sp. Z2-YC6860]|uniref:GlcG/HbpS family heme-binding protein n=1 Tax=Rhodoplanes sp. Z2-YC6860 TaxID=674703 RepID=UPI0018DCEE6A|nr:heme-binding protein [Rhodoplanes sp. Z2-YC6860]
MRSSSTAAAYLIATVALLQPAHAEPPQGVVMVRDLSLQLAKQIAQAALDHCRAQNFKVGVSVVDRGAHVLISIRDDGTAHHVIELAERKAYTARIFRQTTGQFVDRIISNPRSQGLKDTKGVLASLGGVPIKVGDDTIGSVGVSGAPGGQNDEDCAAAGVAKVADQLK